MEENVVSAAGTSHMDCMTLSEMERLIADAGFVPQRRNTRYQYVPAAADYPLMEAALP